MDIVEHPYSMDEFKQARQITETQMNKDLQEEGILNKYMMQAMSNPVQIASWGKTKHEKVQIAKEVMKKKRQRRLKVINHLASKFASGEVPVEMVDEYHRKALKEAEDKK